MPGPGMRGPMGGPGRRGQMMGGRRSRNPRKTLARIEPTEIPCGDQITMIPFSAETGEGVEEIHAILEEISDGIRQEEAVIPPGDDENRGN